MEKLPETIEKDLIGLLNPEISDGTLKNKRNLLVSSFTIITVYVVGKSITDLRLLGLNLEGADSSKLLLVAMVIIVFWLCMFFLHAWKDNKIIKAKRSAFDNQIKLVKENVIKAKKIHLRDPEEGMHRNTYLSAVKEVEKYDAYQKRLKTARWLTVITFTIEYSLPALFALLALYFLGTDYVEAINTIKP